MIEKIEKKERFHLHWLATAVVYGGSARAARPPAQRRVGRFGVVGGGRQVERGYLILTTRQPWQHVRINTCRFLFCYFFLFFVFAHISSDSINRRGKISIRNGHRARLSRKKIYICNEGEPPRVLISTKRAQDGARRRFLSTHRNPMMPNTIDLLSFLFFFSPIFPFPNANLFFSESRWRNKKKKIEKM